MPKGEQVHITWTSDGARDGLVMAKTYAGELNKKIGESLM